MKKKERVKDPDKIKKRDNIFTIILSICDVVAVVVLFLLYGPFNGFRDWLVTTAMSTMNHQYFATTFYSDEYINKVLAGEHVEIFIDFMQDTSKEEIVSLIRNNPNKNISTNLKTILPDGFVKELLNILNLSDVKGNSLTKEDENSIVEYIKNMKLTITSSLGFKGAMVTCGGVSTKEVDASTLESKKIENLFITGELLDLDAETGGYNLQIAFSTGYLAGLSLN